MISTNDKQWIVYTAIAQTMRETMYVCRQFASTHRRFHVPAGAQTPQTENLSSGCKCSDEHLFGSDQLNKSNAPTYVARRGRMEAPQRILCPHVRLKPAECDFEICTKQYALVGVRLAKIRRIERTYLRRTAWPR